MTEHTPDIIKSTIVSPGDACTIRIGTNLVLTGWVNRVERQMTSSSHTLTVSGRSRCQDLVDCSAIPKGLLLNDASVARVARDLVAPFDGPINVLTPDGDGDGDGSLYSLGVSWQQTPWEIISEIATYEGLLVHDDARGDLVICKVGTERFASGFVEGDNVQEVSTTDADDMLFSKYVPALMAQDSLQMIGPGGNRAGSPVPDKLVKRYRPYVVISDQPIQGELLAQKRAVWEATRRRGRAKAVNVIVDSWRDAAGTLWTHNVLAPVNLPSLHLTGVEWILAAWEFSRNGRTGTSARALDGPAGRPGSEASFGQAGEVDRHRASDARPALTTRKDSP